MDRDHSPLLKKTCVRQVVLDKWSPLRNTLLRGPRASGQLVRRGWVGGRMSSPRCFMSLRNGPEKVPYMPFMVSPTCRRAQKTPVLLLPPPPVPPSCSSLLLFLPPPSSLVLLLLPPPPGPNPESVGGGPSSCPAAASSGCPQAWARRRSTTRAKSQAADFPPHAIGLRNPTRELKGELRGVPRKGV